MTRKISLLGILVALIMIFPHNTRATFNTPVTIPGGDEFDAISATPVDVTDAANFDSTWVTIQFASSVKFPDGKVEAEIGEVELDSAVQQLFLNRVVKMRKAYPNFTAADTVLTFADGSSARIGDLSRTVRVKFNTKEDADWFLQQVKTPQSLKLQTELTNNMISEMGIRERNLSKSQKIEMVREEISKNPQIQQLIQRHQQYPEIDYAEPHIPGSYFLVPDDPLLPQQWPLKSTAGINAIGAWDFGTEHKWGIVIHDRGIHAHRDITFTGQGTDVYAHGLACAGIAAAQTNNGTDMAGIAWNMVIGSSYAGDCSAGPLSSSIYNSMGWPIHNISGGPMDESFELGTAVRVALNNGKLLVCASGNDDSAYPNYPAYWALAVGATNNYGQVEDWSNGHVELVAPGGNGGESGPEDVLSLWYQDPYYHYWSGTSYSAPHVAGVAAILSKEIHTEQNYNCTRSDLQRIMELTATDLVPPGYDTQSGWGRVNAKNALELVQSDGGLRIKRSSASSYSSYSESGPYAMTLVDVPGLGTQTYLVFENIMYKNVEWNHPCTEVPYVWVNSTYTNGWKAQNPQYGEFWGDVVDGSITTTGATLRTHVYHVYDFGGWECGWYPCQRHQVSYDYSILGHFNMFAPFDLASELRYSGGDDHYIRFTWSDTNEWHDGYQLWAEDYYYNYIDLPPDCHLYDFRSMWGSYMINAKVRARIGEEYGPWSNLTSCRNAPNIPSDPRVSVKHVCGWPVYTKVTPEQLDDALDDGQIEEYWVPADSSLELRPDDDDNDPPCFPTNEIKVTWDTPEYQLGEPDYYMVRLLFYTSPPSVFWVGPVYGHEIEFCTWPNWEHRLNVVAYKYGLHSNETENVKIFTTGGPTCDDYPFGKSPPDDGQEPEPLADKPNLTPAQFSLFQNYPNPFNPETEISYTIPQACYVKLTIYNMLGQKVKVLVNEQQMAGFKTVHWDGKDQAGNEVSSGNYFYRLQAGEYDEVRKMILVK